MAHFTIYPEGSPPFSAFIEGRELWAMENLMRAGEKGCTPISNPGPRWSAYVHKLRKMGVPLKPGTKRTADHIPATMPATS